MPAIVFTIFFSDWEKVDSHQVCRRQLRGVADVLKGRAAIQRDKGGWEGGAGYQGPCAIQAGAICSPVLGRQKPNSGASGTGEEGPGPWQAAS